MELNGWGPLLALWIGGVLHLGRLIWREHHEARRRGQPGARRAA